MLCTQKIVLQLCPCFRDLFIGCRRPSYLLVGLTLAGNNNFCLCPFQLPEGLRARFSPPQTAT